MITTKLKKKVNYYPFYEKLAKMPLERSVVETVEFQVLARAYPLLAESVKLKKNIEKLHKKSKSLKMGPLKFQIKKEIARIEAKLKREKVRERIRGESGQESVFLARLRITTVKERCFTLARRLVLTLKKLRSNISGRFLSSVFDLKSIYVVERSLAMSEWVHKHRKKPSIKSVARVRALPKLQKRRQSFG